MWIVSDLWMFFPVCNWFDPWFYLGISLNYDLLSIQYAETYYVTRLPSIIPDLVAHKLFSAYWAVVVTSFVKYYLCILPLHWTLTVLTKNRLAAFIPVCILSFYPYFLSSIGWHYVDGYGIGYISLTIAALTAACTRSNWKMAHCCGIFSSPDGFQLSFFGCIGRHSGCRLCNFKSLKL